MISEVLLLLAGHQSSLFADDNSIHPAFTPLLHPGEQQCLEALSLTAHRYRYIKMACARLSRSNSRYVSALCATLTQILRDEYEALVILTEAKVLQQDSSLVARGSLVPLSSIRATFSEWDAPLIALHALTEQLKAENSWRPGPLIDLLIARARTGVHSVSRIFTKLSAAVQRVWRTQLIALMVHGTRAPTDPLAGEDYTLVQDAMPACVSTLTRDSIVYVSRAVGTVKSARWQKQLPRTLAADYTQMLEGVLPEDQFAFDRVVAEIRANVGEWLWLNVLTRKDVEDAVDSLADYFLLRNGEFGSSLIQEIERLKMTRLASRSGQPTTIREQDLQLALLRASLGTSAQQDNALANLHWNLPLGSHRPLPSSSVPPSAKDASTSIAAGDVIRFDDVLLGTPATLSYAVGWPLELFLTPVDLNAYGVLFAFLTALRRTHTRVNSCWASLSGAQRARRRWTGVGEGGTIEDAAARKRLARCGWGVVREMAWFLDTLLGYLMTDVVDAEFRRLKALLTAPSPTANSAPGGSNTIGGQLDFNTLRTLHATYLERLLTGSLLANSALTSIIRPVLDICDRFVGQVERWGGDVLPALLFEGNLGSDAGVGSMVKDRLMAVSEINENLHTLLQTFYEQLSLSTAQQAFGAGGDASKSVVYNYSVANITASLHTTTFLRPPTTHSTGNTQSKDEDGDVRRHIERLLLRLDYNGGFSNYDTGFSGIDRLQREGILKQGGLA